MKTMRFLLALIFLVAGMLVGMRLEQGRAFALEADHVSPLSINKGALLVHASDTFGSRTASVDNKPTEAVNLPNILGVLKPQANDNQMAAVGAATRLMLMTEDEPVFLPLLLR